MHSLASLRTVGSCVAIVSLLVVCSTAAATSSLGRVQTTTCSRFGTTWAHSYDVAAAKDGNPTRIVSACCKPTKTAHVQSCLLKVGLVGVRERGCESVNLGPNGTPVSEGVRVICPKSA